MAASAWKFYDQAKLNLGLKLIDLNTDAMKMALFTSASNANNNAVSPGTYATLTNEVAAGNGYSTGGVTVTPSWTNFSGTETLTTTDATWTPTGSGIVARYAVIYCNVTGYLVCWTLLDTTPADVNVATIQNPSGVQTLA